MKFEDLIEKIYDFNDWFEDLEAKIIEITFPTVRIIFYVLLIIWTFLLLYQFVRWLI